MYKHVIFCFSGTGNSLYVAKQIAKNFKDSIVVPMTGKVFEIDNSVESIGFIYPTYFSGIPVQVGKYIQNLVIDSSSYLYVISTYGGLLGNGFKDFNTLIKKQINRDIDYGDSIHMFDNYVAMYAMKNSIERIKDKTINADAKILSVIANIQHKKKMTIKKSNVLIKKYYDVFSAKCLAWDKDFNVSSKCTNCKRCEKICPVQNIIMNNNKPTFKGKCEQCMACIQTCPVEAINYKDKTQTRGRYFHPEIKVNELVSFNHQND